MHPILWSFEVAGKTISVHAFGTLIVVGFLAASFYVQRRAHRDLGLEKDRVFNVLFWLLILGILAGRLLYALLKHDQYRREPLSFLYVWEGGLVLYGGIIASALWLAWYLARHPEMKGFAFLDIVTLGLALGLAVGRWASFLSGEAFGVRAPDLPWAVTFPAGAGGQAPAGVPLQPTQIYLVLLSLLLFLVLWLVQTRRPPAGRVTGLFLMLYALGRVVIEIFRADWRTSALQSLGMDTSLADGLYVFRDLVSWNQLLSIPVFFAGLAIVLIRRSE
ncbi:MAG: prolipoprotein diacylglyceryl transferase [Planctomycetota bacterium]